MLMLCVVIVILAVAGDTCHTEWLHKIFAKDGWLLTLNVECM